MAAEFQGLRRRLRKLGSRMIKCLRECFLGRIALNLLFLALLTTVAMIFLLAVACIRGGEIVDIFLGTY